MKTRYFCAAVLLCAAAALAQSAPPTNPPGAGPQNGPQNAPQKKTPELSTPAAPPDSKAPAPTQQVAPPPAPQAPAEKQPDRAASYYHYTLAHIYEELVGMYQRPEFVTKAIEEYKLALETDPTSEYLNSALAELYAKAGRIRDAVADAQELIKRNPDNLEARRLLGRIYLRTLGDMNSGAQSQEMLRLAIEQYEQIVRIDPKSVEDHLLLGRLYRTNNELPKAEAEFKKAIELQPGSEEALTSLAYLYNDENNNELAARTLNALPEGSRTAKTYSALGYTYEQEHNYQRAVESYKKAVDLDHDNLDAVRGLAQNLLNDGQTDAALEQYRAVADADPQDAQTYLRIAEIYRRSGKYDEALDALKKVDAIVSDLMEVPFMRAQIYEAQGRYDEAAEILQGLIQKTTNTTGAYTGAQRNNRAVFYEHLGNVYKEANKPAQAIETYRKILDLGPDELIMARGYDLIIETYRDNKQWQQATNVAQEAVQKLPGNRQMKLVLAGQLADVGKADEAIAQGRSLLKGNSDDREVYVALGQIYIRLKRWNEAQDALQKANQLSDKPDDRLTNEFLLASIDEQQKHYDEAEQRFKKILAEDPHNAGVLNYLGYMLAERGVRLDEAIGYVKKALDVEPQNGSYLDSLGWVYFKMGNYEQAEENLRKASERMNNDPTIQAHLGDLYQKTGRLKLAATHWERAVDEWTHSVPADIDQTELASTQKKLESAKVKLAQEKH